MNEPTDTVFSSGTGRQTHTLSMYRYHFFCHYTCKMCLDVFIYINRKEKIVVTVVSVLLE